MSLMSLFNAVTRGDSGHTVYLRQLTENDRYVVAIHNNEVMTQVASFGTTSKASWIITNTRTLLSMRQHVPFDTVGYWVSDDDVVYVEAGRLYASYQDAYEAAVSFEQQAIYDRINDEVIYVDEHTEP